MSRTIRNISYIYMSNITFTRRLMLRRRARPHSTRPTSNYISWPCNDIDILHCAGLASCGFGHVPVRICPAAEKWWYLSRFAGTLTYMVTVVWLPLSNIAQAQNSITAEYKAMNINWLRIPNVDIWNIPVLYQVYTSPGIFKEYPWYISPANYCGRGVGTCGARPASEK